MTHPVPPLQEPARTEGVPETRTYVQDWMTSGQAAIDLELRLRAGLDEDDSVDAADRVLDAGWLPPAEVKARIARAVADELDRLASNLGRIRPIHGTELADLAAEWREGRR